MIGIENRTGIRIENRIVIRVIIESVIGGYMNLLRYNILDFRSVRSIELPVYGQAPKNSERSLEAAPF
ncbi:hypothetical protein EVAR_49945_1 [Eumeta japonica]|uniref:Uncharacterized protein n=1 Tax=Eumeta variegata TaxID=151549 RepID=A0A4C1XV24_EUMVA|nr:hypothetical protein EVAR_49945_1 [Eumeta japonica]